MMHITRNEELLLQAIESIHTLVQTIAALANKTADKTEELRLRIEKLERSLNIKKEPF